MSNKKVKNAQSIVIDNIKFKSKLEGYCYQQLKEVGLSPKYEPIKVTLLSGFIPDRVKIITPKKKGSGYNLLHYCNKIRDITYTPDFMVKYKDNWIFIETKGKPNDSYPLKKKMFLKYCQDVLSKKVNKNIVFMEPHNQKQVKECVNMILTDNL